jgi:hypothetical protein
MRLSKKQWGLAVTGGAITVLAITAAGCGDKANEPFKDAPRSGSNGDPALVVYMPDGFSNLSTKCVNGIRYTVAYHGDHAYGSIAVTPGPNNGC